MELRLAAFLSSLFMRGIQKSTTQPETDCPQSVLDFASIAKNVVQLALPLSAHWLPVVCGGSSAHLKLILLVGIHIRCSGGIIALRCG